ncbi:MAG: thymidylate synthase [Rhodospirillales bacterium]|nr:thymidylate synthase [Rhodospirillales bacterium]
MADLFKADTANAAWKKAFHALNSEQGMIHDSRCGDTVELLHASFSVADPRQRWVLSRTPGINPAFAIVECFWILAGRNDAHMINYWNPVYSQFAGKGKTYDGAYGERLRSSFGFDQVARIANVLRNSPESRQAVLQIWNPVLDLPDDTGKRASEDVPCNICAMLKIRDGRLEWSQIMRSNDLFLGMPYNFVQFMTLQELMAGWLGVHVGTYHHVSDSLHYYASVAEKYGCDDSIVVPENPDVLALDWSTFEDVIARAIKQLDLLREDGLTPGQFRQMLMGSTLPPAYKNMIAVAATDSARRRGWGEEMIWAMELNRNPVYTLAWDRWYAHRPLKEKV